MIMIVAHQEEFREHLSKFLRDRHFEVQTAPHRQDVSTMVKTLNPCVLVLDMYVAEPSGLNLLRQLRTEGFKGKVVALTGKSLSPLVPEAYRLGVDQIVGFPKGIDGPISLERIECAIKGAMHALIAKRAFEIYVAKGQAHGHDIDDWLEAEHQILPKSSPGKMKKKSSSSVKTGKTGKK